jgi:hypothetical protein
LGHSVYINHIIRKWKRNISPGIKLSREISLNVSLHADDVVIIIQKNEDDLQRLVHHLNQICNQYNFKISKEKTKVMEFWGKHPVRSKIVLQDRLLEQVLYLNYLGCEISKENDRDIDTKLGRFQMLCGAVHRT